MTLQILRQKGKHPTPRETHERFQIETRIQQRPAAVKSRATFRYCACRHRRFSARHERMYGDVR